MQTARGMQGNAGGTYGSGCIAPGECRELPGESKGAGVKCQGDEGIAKKCQGNVRERM